jgi:hypothetical protein
MILKHVFLACVVLHNLLIDYDGRDSWEERDELKDLEDVESDVEGDGQARRDACLQTLRAKNSLLYRLASSKLGEFKHEVYNKPISTCNK